MNIVKTFLISIFIGIFFSACSSTTLPVADLTNYSQKLHDYTRNLPTLKDQNRKNKIFDANYFRIWKLKKLSIRKKDATWGDLYTQRDVYLQNFQKVPSSWFKRHQNNGNFKKFNTNIKKAITVANSNLRVFPTDEPIFYDPKEAGEGFPFDYNQNSYIKINTPILISHFSKDRRWAFVQAYSTFGWIKFEDIAFVDYNFIKRFKNNNYYIAIKDKFDIFDEFFIDKIQVGTIFPKEEDSFLVAQKDEKHKAVLKKVKIDTKNITKKPFEFNEKNTSLIANEFIGQPYGWGGLLGFRDCSSFTQDFFSTFGIYLDRNSSAQAKNGKYLDMSKLSNSKKKAFIIKHGKPFLTLIYLRGHIMLYIGNKNKEPLVMHSVWGVRTRGFLTEQNRNIIGKNVITTLEYGKELSLYDNTDTVLDKIKGLVILSE